MPRFLPPRSGRKRGTAVSHSPRRSVESSAGLWSQGQSCRLFRGDRYARRRDVGIIVVAKVNVLTRDGVDVPEQVLKAAGDHRLGQGMADLAVFDIE